MNDITGVTPASFEPTIDYVVTKIPRFTFEKFSGAKAELSTSMKSVGKRWRWAVPFRIVAKGFAVTRNRPIWP